MTNHLAAQARRIAHALRSPRRSGAGSGTVLARRGQRDRRSAGRRGLVVSTLALVAVIAPGLAAQRGGRGGPPPTAQAAAPVDLTGYWVSVVTEDWRFRMVTPPKGDYASVPLSAEGRRVADAWDPSKDGRCEAYGAAGLMRMPGRLHITWQDANTLKIETDAGQQTMDRRRSAARTRWIWRIRRQRRARRRAARPGSGSPRRGTSLRCGERRRGRRRRSWCRGRRWRPRWNTRALGRAAGRDKSADARLAP
jgi:hypothetical protein